MTKLYKGLIVAYYPDGDMAYENARPALVLDHSPCEMVASLKVFRMGTDLAKPHIKRHDHPNFEQFPHHRHEQGVWGELPMPPQPKESTNGATTKRGKPVTGNVASQIRKLAEGGMSQTAIVGRLKDEGVTLPQVQETLSAT